MPVLELLLKFQTMVVRWYPGFQRSSGSARHPISSQYPDSGIFCAGFSPDPLNMGGQVQGDKVLIGWTHEGGHRRYGGGGG